MRNKEGLVDDLITSIPGEWKFDEQVSQHFDTHVRKSVPLYEEVQKAVIEISEWFIRDNSVVYDLGSSTGETISLLLQKHSRKKNVRFIGVEESLPMIEIARKKCSSELVQFLQQHIEEINELANIDLVLSLYTLQFLPLWKRKKVLQRIYNGLVEGGAFIFVEKIRAENSLFEDIWNDLYWDFKQENGLNEQQVIKKAQSLRGVLIPLSLTENLSLLSDVGFQCMDTFIKWHNFAGIIAVKMPSKNDIEENTYLNTDKNNKIQTFDRTCQKNQESTRHSPDKRSKKRNDICHTNNHTDKQNVRHVHETQKNIAQDSNNQGIEKFSNDESTKNLVDIADLLDHLIRHTHGQSPVDHHDRLRLELVLHIQQIDHDNQTDDHV